MCQNELNIYGVAPSFLQYSMEVLRKTEKALAFWRFTGKRVFSLMRVDKAPGQPTCLSAIWVHRRYQSLSQYQSQLGN
ncbi:MAG: hypothetical protein AAFY32_06800, partial [Pseudomonadota bacterium]